MVNPLILSDEKGMNFAAFPKPDTWVSKLPWFRVSGLYMKFCETQVHAVKKLMAISLIPERHSK